MARLFPVADLGKFGPGSRRRVAVDDSDIALFNVDGIVYAIDGACVRCGAPLAEGTRVDNHVSCPGCHWEYDVRTGAVRAVPALRTHTFGVTVVGSEVLVKIIEDEAADPDH
jgi:nitrite reductase/ring-hydroxylating ferredoxin subunit